VEAEVDDCHSHAGVTCQVNTPGNVVPGCVPVKENLRALENC
jgi:hypothetical protein